MAKEKATVTLDRDKLKEAQRLTGAANTSATIDVALTRLIRAERLRNDIAAYAEAPPTEEDIAIAAYRPAHEDLADDTDWEALYSEDT